ncbi:DUF4870 domain-containing protein [Chloroflexota bacterium]
MARTSMDLEENVAGLLCYAGLWISGIIFILLELENKFVRFHAVQSIIVFGIYSVAMGVLGWIPFIGRFFIGIFSVVAFILWIVCMVKAYYGVRYKLPWAGDIAERWVG